MKKKNKTPVLSAAVIVKNEESIILRCIENCRKFADEIVIVDTGSTDSTVEIAKGVPGVRVYLSKKFNKDTQPEDFSFSIAKNEAISKCRGRYVIWWDADDVVSDGNAAKIKELAHHKEMDALWTFLISYNGSRFNHCRMFRNGLGIGFDEEHSCHEFINTKGYPHLSRRDIVIEHKPKHGRPSSSQRNLLILRKDYERGMRDSRTLFYLANSEKETGNHENAIRYYDEYLAVSTWSEERCFARYYKASCLLGLARNSEAVSEALRANAEDIRLAEPVCLLGDIFLALKDYQRALLWYQMAAIIPYPESCVLFVRAAFYADYPKRKIEECLKLIEGEKIEKRHIVVKFPDSPTLHGIAMDACRIAVKTGQVSISFLCDHSETIRKMVAEGFTPGLPGTSWVSFDTRFKSPKWFCRSIGVFVK